MTFTAFFQGDFSVVINETRALSFLGTLVVYFPSPD